MMKTLENLGSGVGGGLLNNDENLWQYCPTTAVDCYGYGNVLTFSPIFGAYVFEFARCVPLHCGPGTGRVPAVLPVVESSA